MTPNADRTADAATMSHPSERASAGASDSIQGHYLIRPLLPIGCVLALDVERRTIWIVDAHGEGKRFIVCSDEKLTAFLALESRLVAAKD